ncbi:agmatinase, partial [Candidatus Poribacteria bacterium]|nr:agmatinase [Candidatus Poribacteria bacterium]
MRNFMGARLTKFEKSAIIILPVPYEGTVTYGSGTGKGPDAIIEASYHVEFYDDELDFEPYIYGIHTLPNMEVHDFKPDNAFEAIREKGRDLAKSGKLVIMLGGEHSITPGMVAAFAEEYKSLSVLQLDAHGDLRNRYDGTLYSHACAMRRVKEYCPAVQIGIRSLTRSENRLIHQNQLPVFFMRDIRTQKNWMDKALENLTQEVYITIDVDVFDPSIMPSTGTPEPGGMLWDEVIGFLKKVSENRRVVAFDIVELSPQSGFKAPDFMTAKLTYKLAGYILKNQISNIKCPTSKIHPERSQKTMENIKKDDLTYIFQLTDSATEFRCAMRIDPKSFSSYDELFEKYVKIINEKNMTTESAKNLSVIQDCIFEIDDNGELLDLYEGLILKQNDDIVYLEEMPQFQLVQSKDHPDFMLLDINVDRSQITEEGNPYGYNIRKWRKNQLIFEKFIYDCLKENYGAEADRIIEPETLEDCLRFLKAVGKKIWDSDFELYSRFIGDKLWFKDPAETLQNIIAGRGGTCTEKSAAMKLISDAYGFKSEYLLGGPGAKGPFPVDALREMLQTLDFELGKKYMIYWEHIALLYDLDGYDVMIDVTNGNIPFLFLTGQDIEDLLKADHKKSIKVKMVL